MIQSRNAKTAKKNSYVLSLKFLLRKYEQCNRIVKTSVRKFNGDQYMQTLPGYPIMSCIITVNLIWEAL